MANYCTVVNIAISHDYFVGGVCRVLEFIPTPTTAKIMRANDFLLNSTASGFCIIGDSANFAKFDEELKFRFLAKSTDSHFSTYTARDLDSGRQLYFSTSHREQQKLIPACFSESEIDTGYAYPKHVLQPIFIVDVILTADMFVSAENKSNDFFIHFHANMLHWKYYFFGDLAAFDLEIHDFDAKQELLFSDESRPAEYNYKVFLSKTPILLSEAPKQRFQLKDKNNSSKVLIKRLPNAGVTRLGKEQSRDNKTFVVAEIYVNQ